MVIVGLSVGHIAFDPHFCGSGSGEAAGGAARAARGEGIMAAALQDPQQGGRAVMGASSGADGGARGGDGDDEGEEEEEEEAIDPCCA